jgi:hypothetical protein
MAALKELENIDDECDKNGVVFVKIDNAEEAKEYGIDNVPTLVYFENSIPSLYQGSFFFTRYYCYNFNSFMII